MASNKLKKKVTKKTTKKAKSLRKTPVKAAKKTAKKIIKKPARKLSTHKSKAKSLRKAPRKIVTKKRTLSKKVVQEAANFIGLVTHYFPHVQAAVIKLTAPLTVGETIKIKGHTTDLTQSISSLQMDRVDITSAKKGAEIGVQVNSRVRQGDKVYKN